MPYPSTSPKTFWAGPNILCQTQNYIAFSTNPKHFVPALKWDLLDTDHLLDRHKKFGMGTTSK